MSGLFWARVFVEALTGCLLEGSWLALCASWFLKRICLSLVDRRFKTRKGVRTTRAVRDLQQKQTLWRKTNSNKHEGEKETKRWTEIGKVKQEGREMRCKHQTHLSQARTQIFLCLNKQFVFKTKETKTKRDSKKKISPFFFFTCLATKKRSHTKSKAKHLNRWCGNETSRNKKHGQEAWSRSMVSMRNHQDRSWSWIETQIFSVFYALLEKLTKSTLVWLNKILFEIFRRRRRGEKKEHLHEVACVARGAGCTNECDAVAWINHCMKKSLFWGSNFHTFLRNNWLWLFGWWALNSVIESVWMNESQNVQSRLLFSVHDMHGLRTTKWFGSRSGSY
jgi:hypothetical protein